MLAKGGLWAAYTARQTRTDRHCTLTVFHLDPETDPMKANEGAIDRGLRVIVGLAVLALAFVGPKTPWGYLGLIPLATGLIGWCPLYTLLRINTCRTKGG